MYAFQYQRAKSVADAVSTLAKGVKYDSEDTGLGWKTDAKVDSKTTALPTTCKMERPK